MKEITYEFNDGSYQRILVTDEFYEQYQELLRQEKRNYWRETRRHISLNYLNDSGIDFANDTIDPCTQFLQKEKNTKIRYVLSKLKDKQKILLYQVVFENKSLHKIASETGISHQALSQQLATIFKKLKKFL